MDKEVAMNRAYLGPITKTRLRMRTRVVRLSFMNSYDHTFQMTRNVLNLSMHPKYEPYEPSPITLVPFSPTISISQESIRSDFRTTNNKAWTNIVCFSMTNYGFIPLSLNFRLLNPIVFLSLTKLFISNYFSEKQNTKLRNYFFSG
jgi:hypothetical protein